MDRLARPFNFLRVKQIVRSSQELSDFVDAGVLHAGGEDYSEKGKLSTAKMLDPDSSPG